MKLLMATEADHNIQDLIDATHPTLKRFAKKWNCDFLILDEKYDANDCPGLGRIFYRVFAFYDLLDEYDRILYIDSDMLITNKCPNIFDEVPYEKVGAVYEDVGSAKENRYKRIATIQEEFGDVGWKSGYINGGIFLVSKIHKEIFTKINGEYYIRQGFNDVHLGYNIVKFGFKVHNLSYKFNHLRKFSEKWNGSPSRFDSYIIHYAGTGIRDKKDVFGKKIKNRVQQIKSDYVRIYGKDE